MRPIKFRQWISKYKRMEYGIGSVRNGYWNGFLSVSFDIYPIMQFTGLHDKNDKEIYEGDIVSFYIEGIEDYSGNSEVFFYEGCFCIKTDNLYTPCLGEQTKDYIEVIGNIYENPELLENK